MTDVLFSLNESGQGEFYINEGNEKIAEMVIRVSGSKLTVYHTEVFPLGEGKGLGKQLLAAMVDYARKNQLTVIPLCPFVHAQFRRHPDMYADIWNQTTE